MRVKDAGKKERTTLKEIEELHEQEFRARQFRRCMSEKDIGEEDEIRQQMTTWVAEGYEDDVDTTS